MAAVVIVTLMFEVSVDEKSFNFTLGYAIFIVNVKYIIKELFLRFFYIVSSFKA